MFFFFKEFFKFKKNKNLSKDWAVHKNNTYLHELYLTNLSWLANSKHHRQIVCLPAIRLAASGNNLLRLHLPAAQRGGVLPSKKFFKEIWISKSDDEIDSITKPKRRTQSYT